MSYNVQFKRSPAVQYMTLKPGCAIYGGGRRPKTRLSVSAAAEKREVNESLIRFSVRIGTKENE